MLGIDVGMSLPSLGLLGVGIGLSLLGIRKGVRSLLGLQQGARGIETQGGALGIAHASLSSR